MNDWQSALISVVGAAIMLAAPGVSIAQEVDARKSLPSLALKEIDHSKLAKAFHYTDSQNAGKGEPRIVGAYELPRFSDKTIVEAWGLGFLPVTLRLSNGECLSYTADYIGGKFSNGKAHSTECVGFKAFSENVPHPAPEAKLRLVGSSWHMNAWVDDKTGVTTITKPYAGSYSPLFTANFPVESIMAMIDPHGVGADITLVGEIDGVLSAVTVSVGVR